MVMLGMHGAFCGAFCTTCCTMQCTSKDSKWMRPCGFLTLKLFVPGNSL